MAKFNIHIKQIEKTRNFGMLNFQDEINEMYDDIITAPSKKDLAFFVLVFFLGLNDKSGNPFLVGYLKSNLIKLEKFTNGMKEVGRKLRKHEYADYKNRLGLEDFFKNDTFFILLYSLKHIEYYRIRYRIYFQENPEIEKICENLNEEFGFQIERLYNQFSDVLIEDDRIDPNSGDIIDLSKSVSKTIEMRMDKKIENSIKKYTQIEDIKSRSPIDLSLIQEITGDLIFYVWDQFKVLAHYGYVMITSKEFIYASTSGITSTLATNYIAKKNQSIEKKESQYVINNFGTINNIKQELNEDNPLLMVLIDNLVKSNELREKEIVLLKERIAQLEENKDALNNKKKEKVLKRLKVKLTNLVNLSVEIEWDTKASKSNSK